jgi:hypothetical protein
MISLFLSFSLHCSKMGVSSRCDKDFTRTLGEAAKQKFDKFKHISASCCEINDDVSVNSTPALLGDASGGDSDAIVVVGKRGELAEAKRRQLEMLIQEEQEEEKRRLALSREAWFSMMRRRKEVGGENILFCFFKVWYTLFPFISKYSIISRFASQLAAQHTLIESQVMHKVESLKQVKLDCDAFDRKRELLRLPPATKDKQAKVNICARLFHSLALLLSNISLSVTLSTPHIIATA